ncbi:MAG: DNA mismatch repair protein MutS, partial [Gemmatimonadota bacterium]|nr:DNA mismatch repair protein MutS [Gemmatimonadota bacterium]
ELTQLADELVALRNYNVGVREAGDQVLFLHRLQPGGADRSYGIEVGRLAGLPEPVLARARAVLKLLEGEQLVPGLRGTPPAAPARREPAGQLGLFAAEPHPVVARLRAVEADTLTPLQALSLLSELSRDARGE